MFNLAADAVLTLHFALVLFVVGGLALIVIGNLGGWCWVNALWFRLLHLVAIAIVVAGAWLGFTCPLTTLEMWLRTQSGAGIAVNYSESFIGYWLQRLLFYAAPPWVFVPAYTVFAAFVVAVWIRFPPELRRRKRTPSTAVIPIKLLSRLRRQFETGWQTKKCSQTKFSPNIFLPSIPENFLNRTVVFPDVWGLIFE